MCKQANLLEWQVIKLIYLLKLKIFKKQLLFSKKSGIMFFVYGVWRSLVARTAGGREVAGSNPVAPIFLSVKKS